MENASTETTSTEAASKETDIARYARTMNPYWVDVLAMLQLDRPWREARGCMLIDDAGREYLDATSGFGTATLGHRSPAVEKALIDHLQAPGVSISTFGWSSEASKVADTLLRLADADFDKVQFFSSGAEAVEAALKFAAIATGRRTFLSLNGGFHGLTGIATALAGEKFWSEGIATPLEFAETLPSLDPEIVRARLAKGDVAAVLLEPIQASAGSIEQASEHLAALSDACRETGTMLIADEVASGIGRTGRWFGFHHWRSEFRPDMVVVSKGLTGALLPVSAVLCKNTVFDAVFGKGRAKIHGATMAGNPMSMACASAVLAEAERIDVCRLAAEGERIFRAAMAEHDPAGEEFEITGRGLMLAVRTKRVPLMELWVGMREHNVVMAPAPHRRGTLLMTPPLIVSAAQLQSIAQQLVEVARSIVVEPPAPVEQPA